MFKKLLASVGIGNASVDTRLVADVLEPGGQLEGEIYLKGGDVDQQVSGLELALMTRVDIETDDGEFAANHCIQSWRIPENFAIEAGIEKVIPFSYELPAELPVTSVSVRQQHTQVWLQTGVDIDLALDPTDQDYLSVKPTPVMQAVLDAMGDLGFTLQKADVEKGYINTPMASSTSGCYQEFEFKPKRLGFMHISEVEISFVPVGDQLHVLLEVDKRFSGDQYQCISVNVELWTPESIRSELATVLNL